jgi:hypothetical protein
MKKILFGLICFANICYSFDNYYYQNNIKIYLNTYPNISRSSSDIDYYKNNKGIVLGVSDKIIVKLKKGTQINIIVSSYDVSLDKQLSDDMYLLKVKDKNLTIDIANRLNEREETLYAHPDFIKKRFNR